MTLTENLKIENAGNCKIMRIPLPMVIGGKYRWKIPSLYQNGLDESLATKDKEFTEDAYLEWQVGYDVLASEADKEGSSKDTSFKNYKFISLSNKEKYPYEIAEILLEAVKNGIIDEKEIDFLYQEIESSETDIEKQYLPNVMNIGPIPIAGIQGIGTSVLLPGFTIEIPDTLLKIRINIQKQQNAAGYQPMLYLCVPIKAFDDYEKYLSRTAETAERGYLTITEKNQNIILYVFKCFGALSERHKHDVLEILKLIKKEIKENS